MSQYTAVAFISDIYFLIGHVDNLLTCTEQAACVFMFVRGCEKERETVSKKKQ